MDPNINLATDIQGLLAPSATPESTVHYVSTLESLESIEIDDVQLSQPQPVQDVRNSNFSLKLDLSKVDVPSDPSSSVSY